MLEQCLTWYENQPEATVTSLMLLKQIRDLAVTKRWQNLKQSTLRSFVKAMILIVCIYAQLSA